MAAVMKAFLPLSALLLILLQTGCENTSARVLASGWADADYLAAYPPLGEGGEPRTYVFFRGGFIPGDIRDDSLDETDFGTICEVLKPYLAERGYFLAGSPQEADLCIVVNWGMTRVETEEIFVEQPAMTEDEEQFPIIETLEVQTRQSRFRNAKLLGVEDLNRIVQAYSNRDRLRRLEEEQYFFILLGMDMETILAGEGQPIKWVTRFSVPIREGAFDDLLPALARVGAGHVGRKTDPGLTRTNIGIGEATMGELEEVPDDGQAPPAEDEDAPDRL